MHVQDNQAELLVILTLNTRSVDRTLMQVPVHNAALDLNLP